MAEILELRDRNECAFDVVCLGEVMLRFDPGDGRVRNARSFTVSEGGGEYNVGRALRRCFGRSSAIVTAITDNELGRLLEDLMLQGGVNLEHVVWKEADGIGRVHRTPVNFTERGFGVRAPVGVYDRAHSATAAMQPADVDWDHLFGDVGARWFHAGGIFAGLSDSTLAVARTAMAAARRHGTIVSYDINYRPSLWQAAGGAEAADELTRELLSAVDVLFGVDADGFDDRSHQLAQAFANLRVIASSQRRVHSATRHDWSGRAWSRDTGVIGGTVHESLEVFDRVGGGDGFAAGVIDGLLDEVPLGRALALGIAHGALVMTTPGDTSAVDATEVRRVADGGDPSVSR